MNSDQRSNTVIIFDFNRTLFDPEAGQLMVGAREVLAAAKAKGYVLVLVGQAAGSRSQLIEELGIGEYFTEVQLVEHKSARLFAAIGQRYRADLARSYVVGDRATREIALGHEGGWQTVWLEAGKFASERPEFGPTHIIHDLGELENLI